MVRVKHPMRPAAAALASAWLCAALVGCGELGIKEEAKALVEAAKADDSEGSGPAWTIETVRTLGSSADPYYSALAVYQDKPYVVYKDYRPGFEGIWMGYQATGGWWATKVFDSSYYHNLAIGFSGDGVAFVAGEYREVGATVIGNAIYVSRQDGLNWPVANLITGTQYLSLGVGKSASSIDLYAKGIGDASNPNSGIRLGYAHSDGSYFSYAGSGSVPTVPVFSASSAKMRIASDGTPWYAYFNNPNLNSNHASTTRLIATDSGMIDLDFSLDPTGGLHVAYNDLSGIYYAKSTAAGAGSWPAVESTGAPGTGSFALGVYLCENATYQPCIAYSSGGGSSLVLFTYRTASGSWVTESVDGSVYCRYGIGLVVDSLGKVHLSYIDTSTKNLKYACRKALK